MPHRSAERGAELNLLASAIVILLGIGGAVWQRHVIAVFLLENVYLNALITTVFAVGVGYAGYWLARLKREFESLEKARVRFLDADDQGFDEESIAFLAPSLAYERLNLYAEQQLSNRPADGDSHAEKMVMTLSLHAAVTRYIASLLVFLGLLGTFIGLLMAIGDIGNIIQGMRMSPSADTLTLLSELQSQLGGPLEGMGTAFSTSVFGLVTSLFMGFLHLQLSSAQTRFLARFEALDASLFQSVVPLSTPLLSAGLVSGDGGGLNETVARYIEGSQRQMKENLDRLGGIVERTEGMQANFREVLTTIGAEIETTNTAISRLSTNQDLIREALGKMVDLGRSTDENQRLLLAEFKTASETIARSAATQQTMQANDREFHDDMLRVLRQESGAWRKASGDGGKDG